MGSIQKRSLEQITKENEEKRRRLAEERKKSNTAVLKSYRIK